MNVKDLAYVFGCSALLAASYLQADGQLVVNGGFETGDFTGWTTESQTESGNWVVYSGTTAPISGNTVPPHPQGLHAALADQTNMASMILYQDIALPAGSRYLLSFEYYYVNFANFYSPPSLNCFNAPNQQARIDIVSPSASDTYSVDAADILANIFQTSPESSPSLYGPATIEYDMTPFAGQTVRLRFACVNSEYYFNVGVDNIQITTLNDLNPPNNLQGKVITNGYFNDLTYSHFIYWDSSSTVGSLLGYRVYCDGNLVATIPTEGPLQYENRFCSPHVAASYTVTAFDVIGESDPVTITLQ